MPQQPIIKFRVSWNKQSIIEDDAPDSLPASSPAKMKSNGTGMTSWCLPTFRIDLVINFSWQSFDSRLYFKQIFNKNKWNFYVTFWRRTKYVALVSLLTVMQCYINTIAIYE